MYLKSRLFIFLLFFITLSLSVPDIKSPINKYYFYFLALILSILISFLSSFFLKPGFRDKFIKAVVFIALIANMIVTAQTFAIYRKHEPDSISLTEKRFEELRSCLPPDTVAGYIGGKAKGATFEEINEFIKAQYCLAPAVILPDTNHKLIVVNFYNKEKEKEKIPEKAILIKDFGMGVKLLENKDL